MSDLRHPERDAIVAVLEVMARQRWSASTERARAAIDEQRVGALRALYAADCARYAAEDHVIADRWAGDALVEVCETEAEAQELARQLGVDNADRLRAAEQTEEASA